MGSLFQRLPEGPLDIIGDVHGEAEALRALLARLGCDPERGTAQRPIAFVGDLVDRGPDSPAVVEMVMKLVDAGIAQCALGNHELNILLGSKKEGNGWFYGDATDHYQLLIDEQVCERPFDSALASPGQAERFGSFFATLPLVLHRADLRVVHACWYDAAIERLPHEADIVALTKQWGRDINRDLDARGLRERERAERAEFANLVRLDVPPTRDLEAHAVAAAERQSNHPVKVVTSGREVRVPFSDIFFVGGKWRFVQRYDWWNNYTDEPAVVVGHYWRRRAGAWVSGKPDSWSTERFSDWTGPGRNVFCVDYSAGRRFIERARGSTEGFSGGLAALRWPERTLVFDDRTDAIPTTNWGGVVE